MFLTSKAWSESEWWLNFWLNYSSPLIPDQGISYVGSVAILIRESGEITLCGEQSELVKSQKDVEDAEAVLVC